jgi:hypothetical protein
MDINSWSVTHTIPFIFIELLQAMQYCGIMMLSCDQLMTHHPNVTLVRVLKLAYNCDQRFVRIINKQMSDNYNICQTHQLLLHVWSVHLAWQQYGPELLSPCTEETAKTCAQVYETECANDMRDYCMYFN